MPPVPDLRHRVIAAHWLGCCNQTRIPSHAVARLMHCASNCQHQACCRWTQCPLALPSPNNSLRPRASESQVSRPWAFWQAADGPAANAGRCTCLYQANTAEVMHHNPGLKTSSCTTEMGLSCKAAPEPADSVEGRKGEIIMNLPARSQTCQIRPLERPRLEAEMVQQEPSEVLASLVPNVFTPEGKHLLPDTSSVLHLLVHITDNSSTQAGHCCERSRTAARVDSETGQKKRKEHHGGLSFVMKLT